VEFETLPPASVGFLFGLLFDSEDLCDMILWNIGLYPDHTVLHPRRHTLHIHHHENFKFNLGGFVCD
jgi:hypothetical protein